MGHNIDMVQMFGLPEKIVCPRCRRETTSDFDEYDIDCGNPNPCPGEWNLSCYCGHCEYEFKFKFKVKLDIVEEVYEE